MPGLISHQKAILNRIFIERKISFEDPEIAGRVAELDKKFGLTYYPEKSLPLIGKYGLS